MKKIEDKEINRRIKRNLVDQRSSSKTANKTFTNRNEYIDNYERKIEMSIKEAEEEKLKFIRFFEKEEKIRDQK